MVSWADISEAEGFEVDDQSYLTMGAACESSKAPLPSKAPKASRRNHTTLRATAPEFIPTLSQVCTVVGVCYTLNEHEADSQTAPGAIEAQEASVSEAHYDNNKDEMARHRVEQRRRELAKLLARLEYLSAHCAASGVQSGRSQSSKVTRQAHVQLPAMPDATDLSMSTRTWKRSVDRWFSAASALAASEEDSVGSIASSDEWHSSVSTAAISASCDGESTCSE
eukprot:TRINITY_DN93034_c0_g1_i1.p1 TRINITY_DN93034_c0_g1~~TRINITY_DN93034_c0_g1_i1.p1  ORF type:complete len:224 (-),score=37.12 TRINITY_DN93034_c0_g1_i1:100-771(-)